MTITQHDAATNETIEREATAKEAADFQKISQEFAASESLKEAKMIAKASAFAKLEALGLTEDEAKAIIG